ncbi:hypothetical protein C0581_04045 [Candidatus Parcubacteria bacterium]|nr:MAG: hypothetical protein C0581_04045 [Candidatus Parcubacteria bacterium]
MNHKKNISFLLGIIIALVGVVSIVSIASAADPKSTKYGLDITAGAAGLNTGDVPTLVGNIIGSALSLISVLFFILMIYGGILWMLARGKDEQAKKALDTIIGAIIGIIIVLAAYAITNFVFSSVGNVGAGSGSPAVTNTDGGSSTMFQVIKTTAASGCTDGVCDGVLCMHAPDKDTEGCVQNIPDGECVQFLGETDGNYKKVSFGGQEGWVSSSYLNADLAACADQGGEDPPACTSDDDCEGDGVCTAGVCETLEDLLGCESYDDCDNGEYCDTTTSECKNDLIQTTGVSCSFVGQCHTATMFCDIQNTQTCQSLGAAGSPCGDCDDGLECIANICANPNP